MLLSPSTTLIPPKPCESPFCKTDFIRPKITKFKEEMNINTNSTAKARVETLSVKSEPIDGVNN